MDSRVALIVVSRSGSRRAQKFDESSERDAEAHTADDKLKRISGTHAADERSLMHIDKTERRDDQRQDDTGQHGARLTGHFRISLGSGYYPWRGDEV